MAHFIVTFRIEANTTYQDRYDSLVERIRAIALGGVGRTFEETTSFFAFEAAGTSQSVCDDLYFNSKLVEPNDTLLVVDVAARTKAHRGVKYQNILTAALGF